MNMIPAGLQSLRAIGACIIPRCCAGEDFLCHGHIPFSWLAERRRLAVGQHFQPASNYQSNRKTPFHHFFKSQFRNYEK